MAPIPEEIDAHYLQGGESERLSNEMAAVDAAVKPLLQRIPADQRAALEQN